MKRYWSIKAPLLVAGLAFGLILGMPALGVSSAPQAQVQGTVTVISDRDITSKVKQRLDATALLKNAGISVSSVNGIVTLSGMVGNLREKHAAAALAVQVEGVRVVDDELKTASESKLGADPKPAKPVKYRAVPDSRITADVQALLAQSVSNRYKVAARTDHGVVYLSGELANQDAIERIRGMVAQVDGVKSVNVLGLDAPFLTVTY
ncbi:MAG: BON domain-containing protein [Bacillota bacterium]